MITYEPLLEMLRAKGRRRTDLTTELGLSSRTVAKIAKVERLSKRTLARIARYLSCEPDDPLRETSDNPILQTLRDEKSAKISGGIYHELQVRMTYNSNHIEGSRLTQEQTRMIFETSSLNVGEGVLVDDVIETVHHFRAIDYVIDIAEEELTEDIVKQLHYILKHDTKDSMLPWFAVGEYKRRPNMVGGKIDRKPSRCAHANGRVPSILQRRCSKTD